MCDSSCSERKLWSVDTLRIPMFFSNCWDFTTCVKYQPDSLPLGFGIKTRTSAVMEFVFPLSRIYCDDNKSPATGIELLSVSILTSSPDVTFPCIVIMLWKLCLHGPLWTSWVGWHEAIFPASVLHGKRSVTQAWRAEAKICKGCYERNDTLVPEETK